MIRIKKLSKEWKEFKLHDIDLEINEKEYFVVLGPSGAGKTLLLELIAGIWIPDSGKIFFKGRDITLTAPEKRGIALVYQDYMLFPHKTVFENVVFGLKLRKYSEEEISEKANELMELLKIKDLSNRYPRTLSGGEKQRVAIARALILKPPVLLLDEPLSALDKNKQNELIKELKRINSEFGITIIHVTHNFEEALMLADRVAIMDSGRISQIGTTHDIFRKPENKFVADFVGVENLLEGRVEEANGDITAIKTEHSTIYSVTSKVGDVYMSIRPEDITISLKKVETSAVNMLKGRVKEVVDMGTLISLLIDTGDVFMVLMTRKSFMDMEINVGMEVWMNFKASAVHVF